MKLDYSLNREGDALSIRLRGTLDAATAPELEAALKGKLDDVHEVTVDLDGLANVSSMGLRLLLALYKHMEKQGTMRVVNATGMVKDVLDMSGFSDIFALNE